MKMNSLASKKSLLALGIMNGTSLDGIDFVFTKITRQSRKVPKIKYLKHATFSFPKKLRQQLKAATQHQLKVNELALLHHELGRFYADCFKKVPKKFKKIDLIGLHGQTVFHQAPQATLQIGEASYLAATAQVPVVHDFRVSDISLGGQGAPIATLFHQIAFLNSLKGRKSISIHNLGGISNLSLVSNKGVQFAFDTGPANMLMDLCVQAVTKGRKSFDKDGALASKGVAHLELVGRLLKHPYFQAKPPKSCGREQFGEIFLKRFLQDAKKLSTEDKLATLLEFTAWSILLSYQKYVKPHPSQIIFCGGGANNRYLLARIQVLSPETEILTSDDLGWPCSSVEGAAFALLAAYKAWRMPSNLPKTTGASRAVSMGKITEV